MSSSHGTGGGHGAKSRNPADFLAHAIGHRVLVKLNSGIDYVGRMTCLDGFMNIALEETVELVDGKQTNAFGDCLIRGNNVLYISRETK